MVRDSGKGKLKRVAPDLHAELVEYNAMMRALRTSSTQDVTIQLSKYFQENPPDGDSDDGEDDADYMALTRESSPVAGPSTDGSLRKRKASIESPSVSPTPQKRVKSQQYRAKGWIKWPLELCDVQKPQWTLEDEIAAMIPRPEGEAYDDEDEYPDYVPHLSLSTSHFLHSILAVIASYTRPRADSLQNRYNGIDWKFVLGCLASQSTIDPSVIRRADERLRKMYPHPSNTTRFVERMQKRVDDYRCLRPSKSMLDDILTLPDCDPPIIRLPEPRKPKDPNIIEAEYDGRPRRPVTRSRAKRKAASGY